MSNQQQPLHPTSIECRFSNDEMAFLQHYKQLSRMSENGVVRHALRVLSAVEGTPGAWDAINKLRQQQINEG